LAQSWPADGTALDMMVNMALCENGFKHQRDCKVHLKMHIMK